MLVFNHVQFNEIMLNHLYKHKLILKDRFLSYDADFTLHEYVLNCFLLVY